MYIENSNAPRVGLNQKMKSASIGASSTIPECGEGGDVIAGGKGNVSHRSDLKMHSMVFPIEKVGVGGR